MSSPTTRTSWPSLWFEMMPDNPHEVHVNLRGYPGKTAIPVCEDTLVTGGKVVHPKIPCFADPRGHVRVGKTVATVYTANQGADTWHVLYAWQHAGHRSTRSASTSRRRSPIARWCRT